MKWRRVFTTLVIVGVIVLAWKFLAPKLTQKTLKGHVLVNMSGKYRGGALLPATVTWCPVTRTAVLTGISGDTGFVLVMREGDSISAGAHTVMPAGTVALSQPQTATVAVTWLRRVDTVAVGFRSLAGRVDLTRAKGLLSGDYTVSLMSTVGNDTLFLKGRFRDLLVTASAMGCV